MSFAFYLNIMSNTIVRSVEKGTFRTGFKLRITKMKTKADPRIGEFDPTIKR
jgi:hypothetical protein